MPPTSLALTPPDAEWMAQAACAGDWVLMEDDSEPAEKAAKALCRACPVMDACARWTLSLPPRRDVYGVAGGMTAKERDRARRRVRRSRPQAPASERATKWCPHCRSEKPIGQFYLRPGRSDGRDGHCRSCCRVLAREREAARKQAS